MKRRLTLAIGCLACAMPSVSSTVSPRADRSVPVATHSASSRRMLSLADAAQIAQRELDARQLAEGHAVVSVIFLKGAAAAAEPAGHYDVRIHPPARLEDATWLRGFTVALDGAVSPCTTFRAAAVNAAGTEPLSTPPKADLPPRDWGLGSGPRQG